MTSTSTKFIYSDVYEIDIGTHVFPTSKYRMVREKLIEEDDITREAFVEPEPMAPPEVERIHSHDYVEKIDKGTLSYTEELQIELPYSRELALAAFTCCGGTRLALETGIETGLGIHIGGGFHHAYPDHGEGFCVFNDVALAAAAVADLGKKAAVIDCDLHQGNGTAVCMKDEPAVFTFSMHQQNNYPFKKEKSDLDVPLPDGADGDLYNGLLKKSIIEIRENFNPEIVIYVAGADVYEYDQLGGLSLSMEDMKQRDMLIKEGFFDKGIPVIVVLAGGYARNPVETAIIHKNSITGLIGQM